MIEVIAYILVGLGLVAAVVIYARRPDFWIEFGWRVFVRLRPMIWAYLSKRMSPEEEAEMHRAIRRGEGDEWLRKWHRRKRG